MQGYCCSTLTLTRWHVLYVQINIDDPELFELEGMVKQLMSAAGSWVEAAEAAAAAAVAEAAAGDAATSTAKSERGHHAIQISAVAGAAAGS